MQSLEKLHPGPATRLRHFLFWVKAAAMRSRKLSSWNEQNRGRIMDNDEAFAGGLAYQLGVAASARANLEKLHADLCGWVLDSGIPICRSTLGLELLHPLQRGEQFVWTAEGSHVLKNLRADIAKSGAYLRSPIRIVDETGRYYRRRLDPTVTDVPFLEELRTRGATDYVIYPLPFGDRGRTCVASFATRSEAGFTEVDIGRLELATTMLSPYAERFVLRRIAVDLLDTYVGHRSGERVFNGQIQRGTAETIEAAILMVDLRRFTRFSDEHSISVVVSTLNDFFDEMVAAVDEQAGEVLKFMGDGLLAIFPASGDGVAASCAVALAAGQDALKRLNALNHERSQRNEQPLAMGLALHVGQVAYGNIGGRSRLDFTVIGPAVNHTSRLLELAKSLDLCAVASEAFERQCGDDLPGLGMHRLRDVDSLQTVYLLPGQCADAT
jgi:adenylate cyclase